jgi:CDP-diacylglycerol--glycerol-3-phosphate 3-phosphatidyltransferase
MKHLPNLITLGRFGLTFIYFGIFIYLAPLEEKSPQRVLCLDICFILLILGAISDGLDGYFARKYEAISVFGRITDPMVDKIMVCGSFVFLSTLPECRSLFAPWMAVIVLSREFTIDGIRGYIESQGIPFPSLAGGKLKMVLQCVTIGVILFYVAHLAHFEILQPYSHYTVLLLIWVTIGITLYSAYEYIKKAIKICSSSEFHS